MCTYTPECNNKMYTKLYCKKHYLVFRQENNPDRYTCTIEQCVLPLHSLDMCQKHSESTKYAAKALNTSQLCSVDFCKLPRHGTDYCTTHLRRLRESGSTHLNSKGRAYSRDTPVGHTFVNKDGYIEEKVPIEYRRRQNDNYALQHRYRMELLLDRPLEKHETVHHINGIKTDNSTSNLQLRSGQHGPGIVLQCQDCGGHNVKAIPL